jgi:hypothetical protein
MTIEELLAAPPTFVHTRLPREEDPLRERDVLLEAQLLDARLDLLSGSIGLLFETRVALQIDRGNTGLLVLRGPRDFRWLSGVPLRPMRAHWLASSTPGSDGEGFSMRLGFGLQESGSVLNLTGAVAEFYVGDVPGLEEAPPDYTGVGRAGVRGRVADWGSPFSLEGSSSWDAGERISHPA